MALTDAEKQDIIDGTVDGVLDSDERIYAIRGTIGGDLTLDEGDTLTLTFTPSTVETLSTRLSRLTPERLAALDLLAGIYTKTQLITSEGQVLVSEASQGRIPETKAYVFAFNRTTGAPVTGDAANITAKWVKDYGTPTALTDTNPTEVEDGVYVFDLSESERTFSTVAYILPESSTSNVSVVGVQAKFTMLESLIRAKTDLFGVSNAYLSAPVIGQQLTRLVIGDDYLTANGRQLTFTFSSNITPASTTLRFTEALECSGTPATFNVTGSASASGGVVTCVFEINAADWAGVTAGTYSWVVEVVDDNGDVMTAINSLDQRVSFVEFQTVEGR